MSRPRPPRDALPFLLMSATSAVAERIDAAVRAAGHPGLRPVHGLIFGRIASGGATINEIAAHLGITKQSAAAIVGGLEKSGIIERRPHPTDRRAVLIELTPLGHEITRVAADAAAAETRSLEEALGQSDSQVFLQALGYLGAGAPPRSVW
ncbi:MarR family winged helix-turn-helix transcriptional regulator [Gordonia sp. NB41Y]|uniref:MarR family winged helix-turn-helix transcriptional regulator n=1 Tax=Gordonia sp. NB41Y TaxID=875808 RepID=UPI0006B171AF|nr:MarR family winged helix-turn-helix transcriptional regulator [Gordonia sp. NB41Y]KOY49392.1 MarR family transcriptional regulator [Gordonia sp. NB41Y]WLP91670.1 MarR family winged helix-turn-helix transcriptional regulator [Gordonia sp. NB41Y]